MPMSEGDENTLTSVKVPAPSKAPPLVSPGHPKALLASETSRKRTAYVLAALSWVICAGLMWSHSRNLSEDPKIFAIDGAGTVHYGKATALTSESTVFWHKAMEGAEAILTVSPDGYKWATIIPLLFTDKPVKQLNEELNVYLPRWKAAGMSQWPTVEKLEISDLGQGFWRATVTGFVDRRGVVQNEAYYVQPRFVIKMNIIKNPALQASGDWPFVISAYKVEWEKSLEP